MNQDPLQWVPKVGEVVVFQGSLTKVRFVGRKYVQVDACPKAKFIADTRFSYVKIGANGVAPHFWRFEEGVRMRQTGKAVELLRRWGLEVQGLPAKARLRDVVAALRPLFQPPGESPELDREFLDLDDASELGPEFFENPIVTRPGESIIESVRRAREQTGGR